MEKQITQEQQEQIGQIAGQVEKTLESVRKEVGEMVTRFGDAGEHPLGVALALAMASATVIASVGVVTNMPRKELTRLIQSMQEEALKVGEETFNGLAALKEAGITPAQIAEIRKQNA